ncbi:putative cytoplasmic dynein light chain [Operophtera brumata]|uniref:Putative cytoplasmic dynein light chain n=1 Tax=Operophtera brumata TaxID=104452 RepID=A0A0L7LAV3_OPEBR|nr:putative cytoplasmic dynein light chain [Operophtera brumata]
MAAPDDEEEKIIRDNIELCLGGNTYSHTRAPVWITVITEKTLARLNKLNKPFKYIGLTKCTCTF